MNKKTEALEKLDESIRKLSGIASAFDVLGCAANEGQAFIPVGAFVALCEVQFEIVADVKEFFNEFCAELEKEEGAGNA